MEGRVLAYNLDARACVTQVVRPLLVAGRQAVHHVVMNLPASAIEFLGTAPYRDQRSGAGPCSRARATPSRSNPPSRSRARTPPSRLRAHAPVLYGLIAADAFKGVGVRIDGLAASDLPLIHCYCFTSVLDAPVADILQVRVPCARRFAARPCD